MLLLARKGVNGEWQAQFEAVDDTLVPLQQPFPSLVRHLNKLGAEGWEIMGQLPDNPVQTTLILVRRRSE